MGFFVGETKNWGNCAYVLRDESLSTMHFMLPEATESEKGWTWTNQTAVEEKLNAYFSDKFFRIPLHLISIPHLGLSKLRVLKKKDKLKISLIRTWFILPLSSFAVSKLLVGSLIEINRALKSMKDN